MIEEVDRYRLNQFWCHLCQNQFSCRLRAGIDDIICPNCSNDFCELMTTSTNPQKFTPYQKLPTRKPRMVPRYSAQAVLVALAQYSQQSKTQKYRQISEKDIGKLRFKLEKQMEQCLICGDDYKIGIEVLKAPCGHVFHVECLSQWLEYKNTCPKCRAIVLVTNHMH